MSHGFLNGDQVSSGFVKMESESMSETVEVETISGKPDFCKLVYKDIIHRHLADMPVCFLTWEEPAIRFCPTVRSAYIVNQDVIRLVRKDSISIMRRKHLN